MTKAKHYRSLIGGAIGDEPFEPGDLIPVPPDKEAEWLAAGVIELIAVRQRRSQVLSPVELRALTEADIEAVSG